MEKKIVDAVLEEIRIHGFKFTMDNVTSRLHMSKSSLYKLVGSKDRLIHDLITAIKADFNAQKKKLLAEQLDTYVKIQRFIDLYLQIFRPFNNNVYYEIKLLYPEEWERWRSFQQENIESLVQLLQQGMDAGEFRKVNIHIVRQLMLTSAMSLTEYQFLQESNLTYTDALSGFSDILFEGLKNK